MTLTIELEASNRILVGCLEGRVDTKEDADAKANEAGCAKNLPGDMWCEWRDEGNKEGENIAENEAHETANNAEDNRLKEELEENVATASTYSFADADLASAL